VALTVWLSRRLSGDLFCRTGQRNIADSRPEGNLFFSINKSEKLTNRVRRVVESIFARVLDTVTAQKIAVRIVKINQKAAAVFSLPFLESRFHLRTRFLRSAAFPLRTGSQRLSSFSFHPCAFLFSLPLS
jgi:hypothetical protein